MSRKYNHHKNQSRAKQQHHTNVPKVPEKPVVSEPIQGHEAKVDNSSPEIAENLSPMDELSKIPMVVPEVDPRLNQGMTIPETEELIQNTTGIVLPPQETLLSTSPQQEKLSSEESLVESPVDEVFGELVEIPSLEDIVITETGTTLVGDILEEVKGCADVILVEKIKEYCTEHSIALVLKALCEKVPEALPNYTTWDIRDPIPLIHKLIQSEKYVEEKLPILRRVLPGNVENISWSARVIIAMATYKVIDVMGEILVEEV